MRASPRPLAALVVLAACAASPPAGAPPATSAPQPPPAASGPPPRRAPPPECPCVEGAICVPTTRAGERCFTPCASDGDCSGPREACDPAWRACVPRGLASPRLAGCRASALPRGVFAPSIRVTGPGSPGDYQFEPHGALTRSGDLALAFGVGAPLGSPLGVATTVVHADGTVDPARRVAGKDSAFDPWMAADPATGRLALVWLAFEGARAPEREPAIALATSDDGTSWSPTRYVHDPRQCPPGATGCFDKPMVAWGPRSALYVFYETDEPAALHVVRSTDGGATFGPATQVAEAGYGSVAVDARGVVHVAAGEGPAEAGGNGLGSTEGAFVYARSDDGGASFSRSRVSAEGESIPGYFSNPQVVADADRGLVYVVYPRGGSDGRWDLVLATSADAGRTWSRTAVNDDPPCANHMTPQAALDPATGDLHVTWLENRTGRGAVAHARCARGGARCGPNDAVSDAPFEAYQLLRFSPKWLGEYGTLVVDPRRRLLEAVWTQTFADGPGGAATARIVMATARP